MFSVQDFSELSRPGLAADGPPYAPPGMWITIAEHDTLADAKAGLARVKSPVMHHRPNVRRRIINGQGRVVAS